MDQEAWWEALCARAGIGKIRAHGFLAQGGSNAVHRLETDRGAFVMKVSKPSVPSRLCFENAFLALAGGEIGPRVRYYDGSGEHHGQALLVEDFVPGSHPFRLDQSAAAVLGLCLRKLHERPVAPFSSILEKPRWQDHLEGRVLPQLELARDESPKALHGEIVAMVALTRDLGARHTARMAAHPRTLVHNDVIPLNVLATSEGMVLIDWEWVRIDIPEWDLGSVLKAFEMDSTAQEAFWEAYGLGHDPELMEFVGILHHLNVVAWRLRTFYGNKEYQDVAEKFLADLDVELAWLRDHLGTGH